MPKESSQVSRHPRIQEYMSMTLRSIDSGAPLAEAMRMMDEFGIRHLPVLKEGRLSGILSDRDVKLALGPGKSDPETARVGEVATEDVFITHPDAAIGEVAGFMAEKRIGSAVVVQDHKLVGIFTTTDALRALAEIFG